MHFFRWLILTGQRRSEVAGIRWDELDQTSEVWTIPVGRAKNGVTHVVPLVPEIIADLDHLSLSLSLQQAANAEVPDARNWPTTGTNGRTAISGITKAKKALDEAASKVRSCTPIKHWRIHDLRRTMATGFQRLGVRFEVTEATLNHVSGAKGGVAGIYQQHGWKDEKRSALKAWALYVADLSTANRKGTLCRFRQAAVWRYRPVHSVAFL